MSDNFKDENPGREHFTMIPNCLLRNGYKGMDPFTFTFYCYIRSRSYGSGSFTASYSRAMKDLNISRDRLYKSRRKLEELKLISIKKLKGHTDQIRIIEKIWDENSELTEKNDSETGTSDRRGGSARQTGVVRQTDGGGTSHVPEEEKGNKRNIIRTLEEESDVSGGADSAQGKGEIFEKAERVANHLLQSIISYQPEHRYGRRGPALQSWTRDIEKALRIDGRTVKQLEDLIDYTFTQGTRQADFWAGNIQSGKKLRIHFDRMANDYRREIKSQTNTQSTNGKHEIDARLDRLIGPDT